MASAERRRGRELSTETSTEATDPARGRVMPACVGWALGPDSGIVLHRTDCARKMLLMDADGLMTHDSESRVRSFHQLIHSSGLKHAVLRARTHACGCLFRESEVSDCQSLSLQVGLLVRVTEASPALPVLAFSRL